MKYYYSSHWYAKTSINGVDVSNCSFEESKDKLKEAFANYSLTLNGKDDGQLVINKADVGYDLTIEEDLDNLFKEQHKSNYIIHQFGDKRLECGTTYSTEKLKSIISTAEIVKGSKKFRIKKSKNAYLKFSAPIGAVTIESEVYGNKVDTTKLEDRIRKALLNLETVVDLEEENEVYIFPEIIETDENLAKEMTDYNKMICRWIRWDMGDSRYVTIDPSLLHKWVKLKNNRITINKDAIQKWIKEMCHKYTTVGATRTLTTFKKKQVQVIGGDYGWSFDSSKMMKQAVKAIKSKQKTKKVEDYMTDQSQENRDALTTNLKPVYTGKGFRMDYVDYTYDWNPEKYVEISLTDQMVYVWEKNKCVFKTRCITGLPKGRRFTNKGTYYIKEHMPAKTLVGADYRTPVKWWTRIMWNGIGFHSATWQKWSQWTKNYYKTNGSHGCINLTLEDSKTIYDLTEGGEAVFIY